MKITESCIVVLCENGKFLNFPHQPVMPRLGDNIPIDLLQKAGQHQRISWLMKKKWIFAASILLLVSAAFFLKSVYGPVQSVALVAIDINPSMELIINKKGNVEKVNLINEDARLMISEQELQGREFYQATQLIIAKAEEQGYLDQETEKKQIWVSVVNFGNEDFQIEPQKMNTSDKKYELELHTANEQQVKKAKEASLTINKLVVYEQAKEKGLDLDIEQLRTDSIASTLKSVGVDSAQLFEQKPESTSSNVDKQQNGKSDPKKDNPISDKGKDQNKIEQEQKKEQRKEESKQKEEEKKINKEKNKEINKEQTKEKNKDKGRNNKRDKEKKNENKKDKDKNVNGDRANDN